MEAISIYPDEKYKIASRNSQSVLNLGKDYWVPDGIRANVVFQVPFLRME